MEGNEESEDEWDEWDEESEDEEENKNTSKKRKKKKTKKELERELLNSLLHHEKYSRNPQETLYIVFDPGAKDVYSSRPFGIYNLGEISSVAELDKSLKEYEGECFFKNQTRKVDNRDFKVVIISDGDIFGKGNSINYYDILYSDSSHSSTNKSTFIPLLKEYIENYINRTLSRYYKYSRFSSIMT